MIENGIMHTQHCGCQHWTNKENQYHRLDGPAVDRCNCKSGGTTGASYYLYGQPVTKKDWEKEVEQIKRETLEEIEAMLFNSYAWFIVHRAHDCWAHPSARLTLLLSGYHALIDEPTTYGVFEHAQDVLVETIMKRERND